MERPVSIQLQLPAKNSSYSRFEVARLFLNSLAFGRSDHNLEFHLPVKWDTAKSSTLAQCKAGQLLQVFSGFDGGTVKKYQGEG